MRLTLRTLLAYMDDILDPADHEELGKRIEASEFAAELIHRSRDTVRRLRLGAPEVFTGDDDDVLNPDPASDANAVAEYLDNTLPPEHVAEFERVCLDSGSVADMHLAEVTSCHHVLTMVLGEPAEIDPQVRRRMYELPQHVRSGVQSGEKLRIESAHPPVMAAQPAAVAPQAIAPVPVATAASQHAPVAARVVLPDYLRVAANRRRSGRRWATGAVLMILGAVMAYLVFGAFEAPQVSDEVAEAIDGNQFEVQIGEVPAEPTEPAANPAEEANLAPVFVPEDAAPAPVGDKPAAEAIVAEQSAAPTDTAVATTPPVASATAGGEQPAPESPSDVEQGLVASADPVKLPESSVPLPPQDTVVKTDPDQVAAASTTAVIPGDPLEIEPGVSDDVPSEPAGPVQLGIYRASSDMVLGYVPDNEQWVRLPQQTFITAGNTLLALPKFRPYVVLANLNTYLSGGTQITVPEQELSADSDEPHLVLEMSYGRLLLNADAGSCRVTLHINGMAHEFHLDKSASLAVEVHRLFVPGMDYEKESAAVEVNWYLANGTAQWTSSSAGPQVIQAPSGWKSVNGEDTTPESLASLPTWIENEQLIPLERTARDVLNNQLVAGQPVELRIQELSDSEETKREIRRLAAEASLYVGEFEPFIRSLNDSDQRIAWPSHIAAMRQAIARDPQLAAKLHEEFINVRGPEAGEDLFAMLRGFTPEQIGTTNDELKQGVLLDLVRWLEDDNLDYRVLAIYNLDEIKGTKDLKSYLAAGTPRNRSIAVTKIRQMIEENEFLPLP